MSDKKIWLPAEADLMVSVRNGEVTVREDMRMELRTIHRKTGFKPKE